MGRLGFETEEELAIAVRAWREMEKEIRRVHTKAATDKEKSLLSKGVWRILSHLLAPVDALDIAAGLETIGQGEDK